MNPLAVTTVIAYLLAYGVAIYERIPISDGWRATYCRCRRKP